MAHHSYIFFDSEPSIHSLSPDDLDAAKKEFIACAQKNTTVSIQSYSTLAFKAGHRFALYIKADVPETIQLYVRDLMHTQLGKHLRIVYTLFGMTRPSPYNPAHAPKESAPETPHKYLVVYPFTKTVEWHLLPYDERRAVMKAHVDVGRKYHDKISQLLLYSYGVDDHEFIVSYQMDSLEEFQQLVMDMRATESRRATKNDLPIFLCMHMPLADALEML
jgi:chlorite dismutase